MGTNPSRPGVKIYQLHSMGKYPSKRGFSLANRMPPLNISMTPNKDSALVDQSSCIIL